MIVLILIIMACIAAYYFMRKKLTEKYQNEFVKEVKWILISPIVQVAVLAFYSIYATKINMTLDFALGMKGWVGWLGDAYQVSQAYDSDFQDVALKLGFTSILGYAAIVMLLITAIIQLRGIFDYNKKRRIKAAHIVAFITTVCILVCIEWAVNSVREYTSVDYDDFDRYTSYLIKGVEVLVLGVLAAKFASATDLYYGLRNAKIAKTKAEAKQPSPTATPPISKVEQLQELKKMLDQGILTQQEFDNEKRKLLDK